MSGGLRLCFGATELALLLDCEVYWPSADQVWVVHGRPDVPPEFLEPLGLLPGPGDPPRVLVNGAARLVRDDKCKTLGRFHTDVYSADPNAFRRRCPSLSRSTGEFEASTGEILVFVGPPPGPGELPVDLRGQTLLQFVPRG